MAKRGRRPSRQQPFWADTRRKVVARQRARLQGWFVKHPITFGATVGVKGLVWDIPKWGATRLYSKYGVKTVQVEKDTGEDVTVIEHMDSDGNISSTTITRTAALGAGPVAGSGQALVVSSEERTHILTSSRAMLTHTPLGKAFLQLAGELYQFSPVRGAEAVSTVEMISQASRGFARVSMGVEAFADAAASCGLSRLVTGVIYTAAEEADSLAKLLARTYRLTNRLYVGQINQDLSGATSVSAVPVPAGVGDDAAGILPYSIGLANQYGLFTPTIDQEATDVYAYLGISQAGWALLSDVLNDLSSNLRRHGIDKRVRRMIAITASNALDNAKTWKSAKTAMRRLYQGQMDHEASGVATIRTAPIVTSAA